MVIMTRRTTNTPTTTRTTSHSRTTPNDSPLGCGDTATIESSITTTLAGATHKSFSPHTFSQQQEQEEPEQEEHDKERRQSPLSSSITVAKKDMTDGPPRRISRTRTPPPGSTSMGVSSSCCLEREESSSSAPQTPQPQHLQQQPQHPGPMTPSLTAVVSSSPRTPTPRTNNRRRSLGAVPPDLVGPDPCLLLLDNNNHNNDNHNSNPHSSSTCSSSSSESDSDADSDSSSTCTASTSLESSPDEILETPFQDNDNHNPHQRRVHFCPNVAVEYISSCREWNIKVIRRLWYSVYEMNAFKAQSRLLAKETRVKRGPRVTQCIDFGYVHAQDVSQRLLLSAEAAAATTTTVEQEPSLPSEPSTTLMVEDALYDQILTTAFPQPSNNNTMEVELELRPLVLEPLCLWAQRKVTCRGLEHFTSKAHYTARVQAKTRLRHTVVPTTTTPSGCGFSSHEPQPPDEDEESPPTILTTTSTRLDAQPPHDQFAELAQEISRPSRILARWLGLADAQFRIAHAKLESLTDQIWQDYHEALRQKQKREQEQQNHQNLYENDDSSIEPQDDDDDSELEHDEQEPPPPQEEEREPQPATLKDQSNEPHGVQQAQHEPPCVMDRNLVSHSHQESAQLPRHHDDDQNKEEEPQPCNDIPSRTIPSIYSSTDVSVPSSIVSSLTGSSSHSTRTDEDRKVKGPCSRTMHSNQNQEQQPQPQPQQHQQQDKTWNKNDTWVPTRMARENRKPMFLPSVPSPVMTSSRRTQEPERHVPPQADPTLPHSPAARFLPSPMMRTDTAPLTTSPAGGLFSTTPPRVSSPFLSPSQRSLRRHLLTTTTTSLTSPPLPTAPLTASSSSSPRGPPHGAMRCYIRAAGEA